MSFLPGPSLCSTGLAPAGQAWCGCWEQAEELLLTGPRWAPSGLSVCCQEAEAPSFAQGCVPGLLGGSVPSSCYLPPPSVFPPALSCLNSLPTTTRFWETFPDPRLGLGSFRTPPPPPSPISLSGRHCPHNSLLGSPPTDDRLVLGQVGRWRGFTGAGGRLTWPGPLSGPGGWGCLQGRGLTQMLFWAPLGPASSEASGLFRRLGRM